jgi:outer membrane murein-binding lipoprotein Lpp
MKKIIFLILISVIYGCSNPNEIKELQSQIETLTAANAKLSEDLNECLNGPEKQVARIKLAINDEKYGLAIAIYENLKKTHPDASAADEVIALYNEALSLQQKKQAEDVRIAELEKSEKLKALNKLKKKVDDISGITWYQQSNFTHYNNSNLTSIYLGENGNNRWLRIKMSYKGDDWIFFDKAFLSYEGNTIEVLFDDYEDKESDNAGGYVWEWIDLNLTSDVEAFLRKFANSTDAKMRLSGKYTKTRTLSKNERQGILDVLNGYDALENQ